MTSPGGPQTIACGREVGENLAVGSAHDGPDGNGHDEVPTGPAVTTAPATVGAALGPPVGVIPEGEQRGKRLVASR